MVSFCSPGVKYCIMTSTTFYQTFNDGNIAHLLINSKQVQRKILSELFTLNVLSPNFKLAALPEGDINS